jgi:hypothetical protein
VLKNELATARNLVMSSRTIRRRLKKADLNSRKPAKKTLLTRAHKIERLRFARNHQHWTIDDSKKVLFSDETRVSLKFPDGRERVWREICKLQYQGCRLVVVQYCLGRNLFQWSHRVGPHTCEIYELGLLSRKSYDTH